MDTEDDVDRSENSFLELISSLKSNKQILRKLLRNDEVPSKKVKINNGQLNGEIISGSKNDIQPYPGTKNNNDDKDISDHEEEDEDEDEDEEVSDADSNSSFNESDESEDDDVADDNNLNSSSIDPFKIHFEQVLKEEVVDEIAKSKFEKRERKSLSKNIVFDHYVLPNSITSQFEGLLIDLKEESESESKNEKELFQVTGIKDNLVSNWKQLEKSKKVWLNEVHDNLFRMVGSYKDVFHLSSSHEYWDKIRHLYVLHTVNHVLKSRARVLKNNTKITQAEKDNIEIDDRRDQGLTRPKVLILVPFKNFCLEIVNDIIKLVFPAGSKMNIMNKKRFMQEFSPDPNEKESKLERPDDYKAMFKGNIDDCFRVGLAISKNTLKLFSDFYSADVIIASPLGLRTIIRSEGEKQDFDFLSSIEILIMDQADAFLMQNWEHVTHIFDYLNLIPKQSHNTDFSRVRMSTVNGWSKYYRQTMLFSCIQTPEINGIFNKFCCNYNGKVKYSYNNTSGSIAQIVSQIPQVYQQVNCNTFLELPDKRFDFFIKKVLPDFKHNLFNGTAIFIPSYFDFVRVRNYFKKENMSFVQISEYSKRSNISRSRTMFLAKNKHFLLFTERFHFFYRYRLKGIKHIIFYQLPYYQHFYPEIINFMDSSSSVGGASSSASCTVLYSRFDGFNLEAIVGSDRCKQMISSSKDTHMLITGY